MFFKRKSSFDPNDESSIVAACKQKNAEAQQALIRMHFGFVKNVSLRYVPNREEAEEVVNDSFLKVFTNLASYDSSQPFKAWLRTIVVHTAIDQYRRNRKLQDQCDLEHIAVVDQAPDAIETMSGEEILQLGQQLSPMYRMVFTMYVIDGYTHREIADMLGIKEGTSKSNLQDARHRLQEMIRAENAKIYHLHRYDAASNKSKRQ